MRFSTCRYTSNNSTRRLLFLTIVLGFTSIRITNAFISTVPLFVANQENKVNFNNNNNKNVVVDVSNLATLARTKTSNPLKLSKTNNNNDFIGSEENQKEERRGGGDEKDKNDNDTNNNNIEFNKIVKQGKTFLEMSLPYYKESNTGKWLFAGMIVMTLLNSGVSVIFSYVGKDFWNALSSRDSVEFYKMMTKFGGALVLGAPIAVLYRFQRERLAVHWREWMTDRTLQLYSSDRVYYSLERGKEIDNPDQRIAEDVRTFTAFSLELFLTIITSLIDLVSFSLILYSIQPSLFGAIITYAAFGSIVTTALGRKLVGLNFEKLQREANFRYALVRLRENAESIAFYSGEDLEGRSISERLSKVIENKRSIIGSQRNLEFFTTAYRYLIQIVPVAVVSPQYFANKIQLGVVSQSAGAFNHILSDLSIIVNQFEQLATFSAGIDRLSQFYKAMRDVDAERPTNSPLLQLPSFNKTIDAAVNIGEQPQIDGSTITLTRMSPVMEVNGVAPMPTSSSLSSQVLSVDKFTLCTPDRKRVLIRDLSLTLNDGENLLIVGSSGAGKSSFLRAVAGLWTAGDGSINRPADSEVYFLPQRPYCTLGTLKDQLLYPSMEDIKADDYPDGHVLSRSHLLRQSMSDDDLLQILDDVNLSELPTRVGDGDPIRGLQTEADWSNRLSLGEQQRLAFGRVLVNKPRLVILDEATSALDLVSEEKMYRLLKKMAQDRPLTYVSVGHRPSLLAFHDKKLRLNGDSDHDMSNVENNSTFSASDDITITAGVTNM